MTPTFTVLIGSIGRPVLRHTLDSIARQRRVPGDQVIVSFDAFEMSVDTLEEKVRLVESYGEGFLACAFNAGYHWLGVEQINYALRTMPITGSHVFTMGDDDVFVDGAYETLRPLCAANLQRPILYRFVTPATGGRLLLWDVPRLRINHISGCCIAAPVACVRAMTTERIVTHDYYWIADILQQAPPPLWLDRVLVIARPEDRGRDVTHQGIMQCRHCKRWRYLEDIPVTEVHCPTCHARTDVPGHYPMAVQA